MPLPPPLIRRSAALLLALAAGATTPANADGRAGDFDFYVLALTWSPTYCATDDNPDPAQCDRDPPGFTVHGLWPEYEVGYPDYCASSFPRGLDHDTLASIDAVMPSDGLARYEWRKHGMCSGLAPGDYFALLLGAADAVAIPDALDAPAEGQVAQPGRIEAAFVAANPGLGNDGMSVQCRGGYLTEVRICLTKDLEFRSCLEVNDDTCQRSSIEIPAAN